MTPSTPPGLVFGMLFPQYVFFLVSGWAGSMLMKGYTNSLGGSPEAYSQPFINLGEDDRSRPT